MQFRRAAVKDKERVFEICKTIWEGSDYIPNIYDKWMQDEEGEFTLLLEEDEIVGMAKFTLRVPGVGWLEGLRVAPEARSRGYAKEVTKYYIEKGRQMGLHTLQLSTYYQNYASMHVTESYGFQRIANFYLAEKEFDSTQVCVDEGVIQATVDSPDYSAVVQKLLSTPEHREQKGFIGYGWFFQQISEQEAHDAIRRGNVYYVKEEGTVVGAILTQPDYWKDKVYYVVLVTGSDVVIDRLLQWAEWDTVQKGLPAIAAMVPENQHLKELYWNRGFKHWNDMREVNVFIYELSLKEEKE